MMSSPTLVPSTSPSKASLVVFGRDGTGKPRPSWFDTGSADLTTKAADLRRMRVMGALATENSFDVSVPAGLSPPPQPPSPAFTWS
jgi:hypothetical protein